ncbi:MAG: hypothetical protein KKH22_00005, partial [Proteobacteria bacterium]|nr:hypothetical protein [Pseudomonadota bacterium]
MPALREKVTVQQRRLADVQLHPVGLCSIPAVSKSSWMDAVPQEIFSTRYHKDTGESNVLNFLRGVLVLVLAPMLTGVVSIV